MMEVEGDNNMTTSRQQNELIIDVYSSVNRDEAETKELLQVYLENRRLTDGGDIRRVESLTGCRFLVEFEDSSVRQRLLDRKFLSFNSFLIRCSSSTRTGYRGDGDSYEPNRHEILLRGCESIDLVGSVDDREIMKMYAENLLPDNDVVDIRKSAIFPDTVTIVYTNEYDWDAIEVRFAKRPRIKTIPIRLFKSFKTNTILIISPNIDQLTPKIIDLIKQQTPRVPKYFVDLNEPHDYMLLQIESDFPITDELIGSIKALSADRVEYCANFELVNDLDAQESIVKKTPPSSSKASHKSTQTQLTSSDLDKLLAKELNSSVQINLAQMKLNPTISSSPSVKTTPVVKNTMTLDQTKSYAVGLLNSKQLFVLFKDTLKKKYPEIEITRDLNSHVILAENKKSDLKNENWKNEFLHEVGKFWSTFGAHETLVLPDEIKQDKSKLASLNEVLLEINRLNSAVYFEINEKTGDSTIECYGHKNPLAAKVEELKKKYPNLLQASSTASKTQKQQAVSIPITIATTSQKQQHDVKKPANKHVITSPPNHHSPEFFIDLDSSSLIYLCASNSKQILNDFCHKLKLFDGEIIHNKRGYQIECPTSNHVRVREYLAEFEAKLANKRFEIPAKYRSNKSLDQLEMRIRDFIQRHTFTVMYDVNKADWSLSMIGYRKVIELLEKNELAKFKSLGLAPKPVEKKKPHDENSKDTNIVQKNGISASKDSSPKVNKESASNATTTVPAAASAAAAGGGTNPHQFLINDLKWFQTKILFEKKYFQYVESTFKKLQVFMDKDLSRILFSGDRDEIELAKNCAFEILSQLLGCECESDSATVARLKNNEDKVHDLIKSNGICCVVDAKSAKDKYIVYGTSYEDIDKCKSILAKEKF